MKIKFEAICNCDVSTNIHFLDDFIQNELNKLIKNYSSEINDIQVESAYEVKEEPRTDIISGEPCPICGFNGEMKILNLTDEYVEVSCPQCHNKVKINVFNENN